MRLTNRTPLISTFTLTYDTSANACNAGIFRDDTLISHEVFECRYGHAEHIIGLIDRVIKKAEIDFKDLTKIFTTKGPGSFTGIRVGLSVAKMLAFTLKTPTIGVDSFLVASQFFLKNAPKKSDHLVILDTRKDDFFIQKFDTNGTALFPAKIIGSDQLSSEISHDTVITGDAIARIETDTAFKDILKISQPAYFNIEDIYTAGVRFENQITDNSPLLDPYYLAPPKVTLKKKSDS